MEQSNNNSEINKMDNPEVNNISKNTIKKKKVIRCSYINCNKKLSIIERDIKCKCNLSFCKNHLYFKNHNCEFDYIGEHKKKIINLNPKIVNKCLEVI